MKNIVSQIDERAVNSIYNLLKIKLGRLSLKDKIKMFIGKSIPLFRLNDGRIIIFSVNKDGEVILKTDDKEVSIPENFTIDDVRFALVDLLGN